MYADYSENLDSSDVQLTPCLFEYVVGDLIRLKNVCVQYVADCFSSALGLQFLVSEMQMSSV